MSIISENKDFTITPLLDESPAVTKIQQTLVDIYNNLSSGQTVTYSAVNGVETIKITGPTEDI